MVEELEKTFAKCLALAGSFEGASWGGCTGNFDGMGISAFILQWNLGQGTLQPLIIAMHDADINKFIQCVGTESVELYEAMRGGREREREFVTKITTGAPYERKNLAHFEGGKSVIPEWKRKFQRLGEAFKEQQLKAAQPYFEQAIVLCKKLDLHTERALAFCFDLSVQRGARSVDDEYNYSKEVPKVYGALNEHWRMRFVLDNDLPDFSEKYQEDVKARRMTIIEGRGKVHGKEYDILKEFGIGDGGLV